jgi:hypothetical protein
VLRGDSKTHFRQEVYHGRVDIVKKVFTTDIKSNFVDEYLIVTEFAYQIGGGGSKADHFSGGGGGLFASFTFNRRGSVPKIQSTVS